MMCIAHDNLRHIDMHLTLALARAATDTNIATIDLLEYQGQQTNLPKSEIEEGQVGREWRIGRHKLLDKWACTYTSRKAIDRHMTAPSNVWCNPRILQYHQSGVQCAAKEL